MKCCDITAGMLRHYITWQEKVNTPDDGGGFISSWSDVGTDRAFIKPTRGYERWQSQRTETNITHKIYIRYRANRNAKMRIVYNGRAFQVKAILNIEESNKWFEIEAVEGEST